MNFLNFLPISEEACECAEVLEFQRGVEHPVIDDDLARTLPYCDRLDAALLTGIPDLTDRTLIVLANTATHLRILDVSGCREITDVSVRELAVHATQLEAIRLNSVAGVKDPSISALVKSLPHLAELELTDLPLLTAGSVRDIWTFAKKLRILRLARCTQLTDRGFPHPFPDATSADADPKQWQNGEHSLKHKKPIHLHTPPASRPPSYLDALPPLLLPESHQLENLRFLDLAHCKKLTDTAVLGAIAHAPRIHHISLAACPLLTDVAVSSLCRLGVNLEYVSIAHLDQVTDKGIMELVHACQRIKTVDVSFCDKLTDLAILELATLPGLYRLSMAGLPKATRIGLSFLAEHALQLGHLHISHCTNETIDLDVIQLILRKFAQLENFSGSGVRALTRKGIKRFSEQPSSGYNPAVQGPFRVFKGDNIAKLRAFLEKEDKRRVEAERRNIAFIPRDDDSMALY